MKTKPRLQIMGFILSVLMFVGGVYSGLSQSATTNLIEAQFDTDTTANFGFDFGKVVLNWSWNTDYNASTTLGPNNPGSGCAEIDCTWTNTGAQFAIHYLFGAPVDLSQYSNVTLDVKFDTNSATDGLGSYGKLAVGFYSHGAEQSVFGNQTFYVTNGNGWIHLSFPASNASASSYYKDCTGLWFKIQQAATGANLVGTTRFYLDNFILQPSVVPPPTMTITPAGQVPAGLLMVPSPLNNAYLVTLDTNYSWIGSGSTPVTYSITITNYPGTNDYDFNGLIYMIPGAQAGYGLGDSGANYDLPNAADLIVEESTNGTFTGLFGWKTNARYAGVTFVSSITTSNVLGQWSISFNNDTNFTLSGPGGVSTNGSFPDEASAQVFANPMRLYYGCKAVTSHLPVIFSEFKASGTSATNFDDTFTEATLDTNNLWINDAAPYQGNIVIVPPGAENEYWINWPVSAVGYSLEDSTSLAASGGFQDLGVQPITTPAESDVLAPAMTSNVSAQGAAFFQLIKRIYTQLQVLWPGQTNAPGTVSGYVGSPTPVSISAGGGVAVVNVTINACDSTWHIVNTSGDSISLTSSDSSAVLPATPGTLSNGTVQEQVGFINTGSPTVTATDNTNTNIPPATSDPLTVNP